MIWELIDEVITIEPSWNLRSIQSLNDDDVSDDITMTSKIKTELGDSASRVEDTKDVGVVYVVEVLCGEFPSRLGNRYASVLDLCIFTKSGKPSKVRNIPQ